jgi:hypothetical protein
MPPMPQQYIFAINFSSEVSWGIRIYKKINKYAIINQTLQLSEHVTGIIFVMHRGRELLHPTDLHMPWLNPEIGLASRE